MKKEIILSAIIISIFPILPSFAQDNIQTETINQTVNQSDKQKVTDIRAQLSTNTQARVDSVITKYNTITSGISSQKKEKLDTQLFEAINIAITNSEKNNKPNSVLIFTLLKLELENNNTIALFDTSDQALKERLTPVQYEVTQNSATEKPYTNAYWKHYEEWIYVDIVDGTALFSSTDKYDSNTGWPSFTNPIQEESLEEHEDNELFYTRVEVRWTNSDSHLWHIFTDWPKDSGWLRYCINSASLNFIPKDQMEASWYGQYLYLFE